MWTLTRVAGVYLGIGILVAKAAQWLNRHCKINADADDYVVCTIIWPLVILIAVLALIYDGLKNLFE